MNTFEELFELLEKEVKDLRSFNKEFYIKAAKEISEAHYFTQTTNLNAYEVKTIDCRGIDSSSGTGKIDCI